MTFGLLVALVVAGTVAVNVWMVWDESGRISDRSEDVPARTAAVVLGTDPGGVDMVERLDAAARLYKEGKVREVVVSGGSNPPDYDEAWCMWLGLQARGVPAAAITRDPMGYRTLDSVARAKEVYGLDGVVLISQGFHLSRAVFLARHWGLDAVGYAAPDADGWVSRSHCREWLARVLAVLDVTILDRQPRVGGPPAPITPPPAVSKS
jgi:SanA protein